jgi:hypothetical protein
VDKNPYRVIRVRCRLVSRLDDSGRLEPARNAESRIAFGVLAISALGISACARMSM